MQRNQEIALVHSIPNILTTLTNQHTQSLDQSQQEIGLIGHFVISSLGNKPGNFGLFTLRLTGTLNQIVENTRTLQFSDQFIHAPTHTYK